MLLISVVLFIYCFNISNGQNVFQVQFPSSAPSGNLYIQGILSIPISAEKVPAVILLAGSGPSSRNESVTFAFPNFIVVPPLSPPCGWRQLSMSIFTELSDALVAQGIAVFRYDKRECVAPAPGCTYPTCTTPGQPNCVNLTRLNPNDMVIDAINAVYFLRTSSYAAYIDPAQISLIGHSEGCTVAPYVANQIPIKSIVQLMGVGVPIDKMMTEQIAAGIDLYQTGYDICKATNGPYTDTFEQLIIQSKQSLAACNYWFPLIHNASFPNDTITFGGVSAKYWRDTIRWGEFPELFQTMTRLTIPFLAINSPADNQVWPKFYRPLHSVLLTMPNSKIVIIEELAHFLIDNSLQSTEISPEVINNVVSFLKPNTENIHNTHKYSPR